MEIKELNKGKEAYRQMSECCDQLVASGNWQRVGKSDIRLFLDMYVQSLLLKLVMAGGTPDRSMLTYIATVPSRDILQIGKGDTGTGPAHRLQEPFLC